MKTNKRNGFKTRVLYGKNHKNIINFQSLHYLNYKLTLDDINISTSINEIEIGQDGIYSNGNFLKRLILSVPLVNFTRNPNVQKSLKDITSFKN